VPARTNATSTRAGILRPEQLARHAVVEVVPCDPALDRWVEYHWLLRWSVPEGQVHTSSVVPHPAVNLTVEHGAPRHGVGPSAGRPAVLVTGVDTRRFDVDLTGEGWVVGTKFRPGGWAAYAGVPARALTDRTCAADDPAAGLRPDVVRRLRKATTDGPTPGAAAGVGDALRTHAPAPEDPGYDRVLAMVSAMLADRDLARVEQVAERFHLGRRQVERLFARYVGVGPKWVLVRYRVHDVVTELDAGYDGPLADLAARHGWYDQAHFGRDFQALVGCTPQAYRRPEPEARPEPQPEPQASHSRPTDSPGTVDAWPTQT